MNAGPTGGRRLLVTGSAGFVGPHLARAAAARGFEVTGVGLLPASSEGAPFLADQRMVDILDARALREAVAAVQPWAVVHLAGQSSVGRSIEHPTETFEANVAGTWNLLEAVRSAAPEARVLCVGSADIYGPQAEGSRVREGAPLHPVSPYGLSKAMSDAAAAFYADSLGLDVVRTRSFAHIGAGQTDRFVVPSLARQLCEIELGSREPVMNVGNLAVTRDLTNVESVAEGYLALLERGRSGAAYNVCSGQGLCLEDLVDRLVRRSGVQVRIVIDPERTRPSDIPYLVGDPGAIRRDTGWSAEVDIARSLDQILEEWRARIGQRTSASSSPGPKGAGVRGG